MGDTPTYHRSQANAQQRRRHRLNAAQKRSSRSHYHPKNAECVRRYETKTLVSHALRLVLFVLDDGWALTGYSSAAWIGVKLKQFVPDSLGCGIQQASRSRLIMMMISSGARVVRYHLRFHSTWANGLHTVLDDHLELLQEANVSRVCPA
ncbi:predicted protein [Histoplasma capsulatum G186AR]|uniref:Uncharacterized protein n=1 Tax=Ajellomyces capsulatus (strain G186AR / H82 / ATCC MYA-2454 / RMSCC 2432) TaxID=447093 RepID=C0NM96_AJECG|nr:uncharacterized protein HCBG_04626 [Histoplasma capsulatum G186AR]EEH07747.1 predicted protein [Histoplasma capsulatum G186AR]